MQAAQRGRKIQCIAALDPRLLVSETGDGEPLFVFGRSNETDSIVSALLITIGYFATQFAVAFSVFGRIVRSYTE